MSTTPPSTADRRDPAQALWFDHVNDAIIITNAAEQIQEWNRAAEQIYGWSRAEVIGQQIRTLIPIQRYLTERPLAGEPVGSALRALQQDGVWRGMIIQHTRDGREVVIDGSTRTIVDQHAAISGYITINRDMTDRYQSEMELRETQERARAIMENGTDGVVVFSPTQQIQYASPVVSDILGYSNAAFLQQDIRALVHPDDQSVFVQLITAVLSSDNQRMAATVRIQHQDGRWRWLEHRAINQCTNPAVGGIIVSLHDVTEQVAADLARRVSEERYRTLVQHFPDGAVLLFDHDLRYILAEGHSLAAIGYSKAFLEGKTLSEAVLPKALELLEPLYRGALAGIPQSLELVTRGRVHSFRIVPIADANGIIQNGMVVSQDITERVQAERAVQDQARILDLASVLVRDLDDRIVLWTQGAAQLYGYSREEALGQCSHDLLQTVFPEPLAQIEATLKQSGNWSGTLSHRTRDGRTLTVASRWVLDRPIEGRPLRVIEASTDISARVQAEQALQQELAARAYAEQALVAEHERVINLKNEFMATISHELRTPLTTVLGYAELLLTGSYGELPPRQATAIQVMSHSGTHLLSLINDILDYTKFESGQMRLDIAPVLVEMLCQQCIERIAHSALLKHIVVTLTIDSTVIWMDADERRLKQILDNLLSNALKFTPTGGKVGLRVFGNAHDQTVTFDVFDTGIGIAETDLPRLFQPFVQVEGGLSRSYEGTGLGLALVRQLVEASNGSVSVESTPGQGSRFRVTLPWSTSSASKADSPAAPTVHIQPDAESHVILLVEDNESNISVMRDTLTAYNYRLAVVRNGREALEYLHLFQPALILMDIHLPGMSGIQVIQLIRAKAELRHIPIIALTALAMPGDRERCLEAGANQYLTKPVSLRLLVANIAEQIAQHPYI